MSFRQTSALVVVACLLGIFAAGCGAGTAALLRSGTTAGSARGPAGKAEEIITQEWFDKKITEAEYHAKLRQIHEAVQRSYEEIKEKAER